MTAEEEVREVLKKCSCMCPHVKRAKEIVKEEE
jgi:hypothetical protein